MVRGVDVGLSYVTPRKDGAPDTVTVEVSSVSTVRYYPTAVGPTRSHSTVVVGTEASGEPVRRTRDPVASLPKRN